MTEVVIGTDPVINKLESGDEMSQFRRIRLRSPKILIDRRQIVRGMDYLFAEIYANERKMMQIFTRKQRLDAQDFIFQNGGNVDTIPMAMKEQFKQAQAEEQHQFKQGQLPEQMFQELHARFGQPGQQQRTMSSNSSWDSEDELVASVASDDEDYKTEGESEEEYQFEQEHVIVSKQKLQEIQARFDQLGQQ